MENNYLIHHGIKGQSWGVRNGPPYPLGSEDHNARERKAGWESSLNKIQGLTDEQRARLKKALKIGLIAAGVAFVGYNMYTYADMSYARMLSSNLSKFGFEHFHSASYKEKLKDSVLHLKDHNKDTDFKYINPTRSSQETLNRVVFDSDSLSKDEETRILIDLETGRLTNCAYCTNAAALRRMGYSVYAGTTKDGLTSAQMLKYWKGAEVKNLYGGKMSSITDVKTFYKDLSENPPMMNPKQFFDSAFSGMPNGAFGEFTVMSESSGHSVEWFKEGSNIKIFDNQMKIKYDSIKDFFDKSPEWIVERTSYIRYDNCEPNIPLMIHDGIVKAGARAL